MADEREGAGSSRVAVQRLRRVLDSATDVYLCLDEHGVVVDCNAAIERVLGWRPGDLLGRPGADVLVPPDRRQEYGALRRDLLASARLEERLPVVARRRDGSDVHLEVSTWVTEGDDGRLLHTLSRDVTEQASLSARLAEEARRLEEAQRIAGLGSWEWDLTTDRLHCSTEGRRILDVDGEEVLRFADFASRLHPDDRAWVEEVVAAAVDAGAGVAFDARVVHRDGQLRWVAIRGEVTAFAGGRPVRMAGTGQDVTDRVTSEAELAVADTRFRVAFEHSPLGTLLWRPQTGAFLVNAAACAMLGRSADELLGAQPEEVVHPDDMSFVGPVVAELLVGRREAAHLELRILRADGAVVPVQWTGAVVPDEHPYLFIQMQDITARRAAEAELLARANQDALTGLDNRERFRDRLGQALEGDGGTSMAVLVLDLDGFKDVNDGLGHHAGDLVLREAARRLDEATRVSDTVARLGGDEFAVLLRGVRGTEDAQVVAASLGARLAAPFDIAGMAVHLSASIGIAGTPAEGIDVDGLLQRADVAMYRAKALRTGWAVYEPEHDDLALERLALVAELRTSVSTGAIDVAFQPLVSARSGDVVGMEALARWRHPERGVVPPDQFVPLAEQADLVVPLTEVVLRKAVAACRRWRDAGWAMSVSVNLSAQVLEVPDLPVLVAEVLAGADVPPQDLVFEITETAIATQGCRIRAALDGLRRLGVVLAIDDFGTGYSAMAALKHLPVQVLKIDRSFVRELATDERDVAIVRSLVNLGHELELCVVAEGVETEGSVEVLDGLGCDVVQGFGIARPMTEAEAGRWLAERWRTVPSASAGVAR